MIWIDAQLSPALASWIQATFGVEARAVRDLGLRDAEDQEIFRAGQKANIVVMTKDQDFVRLLEQHGPPPQILWITCGNTTNFGIRAILSARLREALDLLNSGEPLVEIRGL